MTKNYNSKKPTDQQQVIGGSEMDKTKEALNNALRGILPTREERRSMGIFQRAPRVRTGKPAGWADLGTRKAKRTGRLVKAEELVNLKKAELQQVMDREQLPYNTKTTKDQMITAIVKAKVMVY